MGRLYYPEFFLQVPSTIFTLSKSSRFKRRIARGDRMFRRETRAFAICGFLLQLDFLIHPRVITKDYRCQRAAAINF